jgi:glycosyltransferase involved in cell wall biosynthesis
MNAADVALMTSFSEGSPQFIKEAMACNLPIVSVPVGDVSEIMNHIDGCYICTYQKEDVAEKLKMALDFGKRTNGRHRILELGLDSETVAKKIIEVYQQLTTNH